MAESPNSSTEKETELTMCDVLEEEKELEEDANAVLGGSDDKNCSYDQGYVPRQALYACMSCSINGEAGICLACCYACHDGHEVVELYTKRNFRCDCGNSKFNGTKCTLRSEKNPLNHQNKYNQNFRGLYCSCSRPYPDLEDSVPDEMIQCIFCEDWFHGRHLGVAIPEDYHEMICGNCMDSHPFLHSYQNREVDVVGTDPLEASQKCEESNNGKNTEDNSNSVVDNSKESNGIPVSPRDPSMKQEISPSRGTPERCLLKELGSSSGKGAAFWPENWRSELCRCSTCMDMYNREDCEFLLNPDDTIQAYEERGKGEGSESQYDRGLSALSQLDRVKQMEAVRAYTSMKGELKEYLKEFADNKKTVRECDIREFFERMGKRQKLNNGVPHFCR